MTSPAVFLPGILMPASLRYAPLLAELGDEAPAFTKELEVYGGPEPPADYTIQTEVDGLARFADEHGLDRFHLYGHSGGGAVALAFLAQQPRRVLSLAIDEAASDFSDEDRASLGDLDEELAGLAPPERMARFARMLVRDGVELPPPPPPSDDAEMAKRPAGLIAFAGALRAHTVDHGALAAFPGPVLYTYGSLSNPRWEAMATRLEGLFDRCRVERFEGIHHLRTSHQADPPRVAAALRALWAQAER